MPNKFQIYIIKEAIDFPEKLTAWENTFIDSIAEHDNDYELSERQNKVINRIAEKLGEA